MLCKCLPPLLIVCVLANHGLDAEVVVMVPVPCHPSDLKAVGRHLNVSLLLCHHYRLLCPRHPLFAVDASVCFKILFSHARFLFQI